MKPYTPYALCNVSWASYSTADNIVYLQIVLHASIKGIVHVQYCKMPTYYMIYYICYGCIYIIRLDVSRLMRPMSLDANHAYISQMLVL